MESMENMLLIDELGQTPGYWQNYRV